MGDTIGSRMRCLAEAGILRRQLNECFEALPEDARDVPAFYTALDQVIEHTEALAVRDSISGFVIFLECLALLAAVSEKVATVALPFEQAALHVTQEALRCVDPGEDGQDDRRALLAVCWDSHLEKRSSSFGFVPEWCASLLSLIHI